MTDTKSQNQEAPRPLSQKKKGNKTKQKQTNEQQKNHTQAYYIQVTENQGQRKP